MNKKFRFVSIALFVLFVAHTSISQAQTERIVIKTQINCDHCRQCPSCGKRIYDALHELKGVKTVRIHPDDQEIVVRFKPSITHADSIRAVIRRSGFEADGLTPDKDAYAQLDDCCKAKK